METEKQEITSLLIRYSKGEDDAIGKLFPLVYQQLRKLASKYMSREYANHTLQPTALVHEAYFRLMDQNVPQWQNRSHFYGIAAQLMRRILIDHARAKRAEKRGGDHVKLSFDEKFHGESNHSVDVLALDEALKKLAQEDERLVKVVEMRFFAGLSVEETAEALGISKATIKRDWSFAKAWLARELGGVEV